MTQFFIGLYDYFERHKILFYLSLISCVLLMGFFALQVRFEENITQFFVNFLIVSKPQFHFCRMHIHIKGIPRKCEIQNCKRILVLH